MDGWMRQKRERSKLNYKWGHKFWWQNKSGKSAAAESLFNFHSIRQLRRGSESTSQARALLNRDRHQEEGPVVVEIWSFRLISFFFKWPCCTDFYVSLLYSLPVIGWASLVSNLCHLDECLPLPFILHWPILSRCSLHHMNLQCGHFRMISHT